MQYWISVLALVVMTISCGQQQAVVKDTPQKMEKKEVVSSLEGLSKAYFAAGCFWCVEAVYESVEGVEEAISGYSGGTHTKPTYKMISSGSLRHAEAVEVYYDSTKVSFKDLVVVFFDSQDPTTPNQQGPDKGPQYRSIAFYQNAAEKAIIEEQIAYFNEHVYNGKIVTEVTPFDKFYPAEDYHQNYERLNPDNPYVRGVSIPRLNRFKAKHPELLKQESTNH